MNIRILLSLAMLLFLAPNLLKAQKFVWEEMITQNSFYNYFTRIHLHDPNTIYAVGVYGRAFDFDGGEYPKMTHPTNDEGMIVRMDSLGNVQWLRRMGGVSVFRSNGITTDEQGNVYWLAFNGNSNFMILDDDTIAPLNGQGLLKFTPDGAYEGIVPTGALFNNTSDNTTDRIYIQDDRIYMATRQYVRCFDMEEGVLLWALTAFDGAFQPPSFEAMHFDGEKIVLGGYTRGGTVILGDTSIVVPTGPRGLLFAQVDTSGTVDWLRVYGTDLPTGNSASIKHINKLEDGNYLLSGVHSGTIAFDNVLLPNLGSTQGKANLIKIDSEGNGLQSFTAPPIEGSVNYSQSITALWDDGSILWIGMVTPGTINQTIGDFVFPHSRGNGFLAKMDQDFNLEFAQGIPGRYNRIGIASDGIDRAYLFSNTNTGGNNVNLPCLPTMEDWESGMDRSYIAGIVNRPIPFLELDFTVIQNNNAAFLQNLSGHEVEYTWNFGDGTTANTVSAEKLFDTPGGYEVCLSAENLCGTTVVCKDIQVEGLRSIHPEQHGNAGYVTATLTGGGLSENMTVKLAGGAGEIEGEYLEQLNSGQWLVSFNLQDAAIGFYDVQVEKPGEETMVLENGFEVILSGQAELEVVFGGIDFGRIFTPRPDGSNVNNTGTANARGILYLENTYITSDLVFHYPQAQPREGDLLEEAQNFMAAHNLPVDLSLLWTDDEESGFSLTSFLIPQIPAGESMYFHKSELAQDVGSYLRILGTYPPLLPTNASSDNLAMAPDLCFGLFFHRSMDDAFGISMDPETFLTCFQPLYEEFLLMVFERSLGSEQHHVIPLTQIALGILSRLADGDCIQGLPESFDQEGVSAFLTHLVGNMYFFRDIEGMVCDLIPEGSIPPASKHQTQPNTPKTREFCDIAGGFANSNGGGAFFGAAAARDLCGGGAHDPNAKFGPGLARGYGFVNTLKNHHYSIGFENVDTATLAAQTVIILDTLDKNRFDVETFRFTSVIVADTLVIQPRQQDYTFYALKDLAPAHPNYLLVRGSLDTLSGVVEWIFETLDPQTMAPTTAPLEGFLPPNVDGAEGVGWVTYTVDWRDDLVSGDLVENDAIIYFDLNEPIFTDLQVSGFDNIPPVSSVNELPEITTMETFEVRWTGSDEHAGVWFYEVFISVNDGPFEFWLETIDDSAMFEGTFGNTYSFYVQATDFAINAESKEPIAEATTQVVETFELTLVAEPENAGNLTGAGIYQAGETVSIEAEAHTGFKFLNWSHGEEVISEEAEFTYTMPAQPVTLTAHFRALSSEADILAFSLEEQTAAAIIDPASGTVEIEVETGTDVTSLMPTILISENAAIEPDHSGQAVDYSGPVEYLVTAEDGTQKTWTVTVSIEPNNDATLSGITLDGEPLEGFDPEVVSYTVILPHDTEQAPLVEATTTDPNATAEIVQAPELSGEASILVTAEDGTTQLEYTVGFLLDDAPLYTLTLLADPQEGGSVSDAGSYEAGENVIIGAEANTAFEFLNWSHGEEVISEEAEFTYTMPAQPVTLTAHFRALSSEADILAFSLEEQTAAAIIDPASGTVEIEVETGTDVTSLIPTIVISENAAIEPDHSGQTVDYSGPVEYLVTAEDGTQKTWTVTVSVQPNNDATLSGITLDGEPLEGFDPEVVSYTVILPHDTEQAPLVEAATTDPVATAEISQASELPGEASILVTAEDGTTQLEYTVGFLLDNAPLYTLELLVQPHDAGSVSGGGEYEEGEMISIDASANDGYEFLNWSLGDEIISTEPQFDFSMPALSVTLTAHFRALGTDATLAGISLDGEPLEGFDPAVVSYTVILPHDTEQPPLVESTTADPGATAEIVQAPELPGEASIMVTAEDGTTQLEYMINFELTTTVADTDLSPVAVFPNPAQDYIRIKVANYEGTLDYAIFDITGKQVSTGYITGRQQQIPTSHIEQGLYLIRILLPHETITRRIQIIR